MNCHMVKLVRCKIVSRSRKVRATKGVGITVYQCDIDVNDRW